MKKDICKRFVDFKIRHLLSNEKITQIVTEYANSDYDFARSFYSQKYDISRSTFYKARDYAVIFCLVDNSVFKKLKNKSATNYRKNNTSGSASGTIAHYSELLKERQVFLNSFSTSEIKDIAIKYMEGVSVQKIAVAYDTGEYAIKYLLKKGITSLIFDADTVKTIGIVVGTGLEKILEEREYNKRVLLDCLQNQIAFLQSQIKCYDLYFRNCQNKPSLKSLQDELSEVIRFHKETLLL